jgi:hypothetical protein
MAAQAFNPAGTEFARRFNWAAAPVQPLAADSGGRCDKLMRLSANPPGAAVAPRPLMLQRA